MRVSTVLDRYFDGHVAKKRTDTPRVTRISITHLKRHFKGKHIGALDHATDIEGRGGYIAARSRKVAEPTVRRELSVLVAAANWCANAKVIPLSDVPFVPLPAPSEEKDVWLTRRQAKRLIAEAAKISWRLGLFVWLGLFTGARPSRIRYLSWDSVDFNAEIIDFRKKADTGNKKYGRVKIMPELMPPLAAAYAERTTTWVLGTTETLVRQFTRAVAAAELPDDITPNTLRHTWATWAAQDAVDLWKIAGVLGNSMATVEKKYAHHHPDYQGAATKRHVFEGLHV